MRGGIGFIALVLVSSPAFGGAFPGSIAALEVTAGRRFIHCADEPLRVYFNGPNQWFAWDPMGSTQPMPLDFERPDQAFSLRQTEFVSLGHHAIRWLATRTAESEVVTWDLLQNKQLTQRTFTHATSLVAIQGSSDILIRLQGPPEQLLILNAVSGELKYLDPGKTVPAQVNLAGTLLYGQDPQLSSPVLLDPRTGSPLIPAHTLSSLTPYPSNDPLSNLALHPHQQLVAVTTDTPVAGSIFSELILVSLSPHRFSRVVPWPGHSNYVRFSPDGALLLIYSDRGYSLIEMASGAVISRTDFEPGVEAHMVFCSDDRIASIRSRRMFTRDKDATLNVMDLSEHGNDLLREHSVETLWQRLTDDNETGFWAAQALRSRQADWPWLRKRLKSSQISVPTDWAETLEGLIAEFSSDEFTARQRAWTNAKALLNGLPTHLLAEHTLPWLENRVHTGTNTESRSRIEQLANETRRRAWLPWAPAGPELQKRRAEWILGLE